MKIIFLILILALISAFTIPELEKISYSDSIIKDELKITMTPAYINRETRNLINQNDIGMAKQYLSIADSLDLPYDLKLNEEINNLDGSLHEYYRNVTDFTKGFIFGEGENIAQISGSVTSDLTLIGDIRDLSSQANNYYNDEPVDSLLVGLSVPTPTLPFV